MLKPTPADIREIREYAGLTQQAAADLVYRTKRMWQMWEAGQVAIDQAAWELFLIKIDALQKGEG